MKQLILFYFTFFFFLPAVLFAQLDQLKNLSPDELKKKALEMGYTEEDFLKYQQVKHPTPTVVTGKSDSVETERLPQIVSPPVPKAPQEFLLTAFQGREFAETLPAFGYNIFTYVPSTFQPPVNIPAPKSYMVGPGDEIIISLWGATQMVNKLVVANDGSIYIPDVGLVNVSGLTLKELKSRLFERLSKVYASLNIDVKGQGGTSLEVSTGKLRSVKVYCLGEITKPGGYTLPALSTSFTALYYSGGPTLNGSLRNVKILRNGKTVTEIDFYDYILRGDKTTDVNLEDGDILFIPPAGKRVAASGSVLRPAIYEIKNNETLGDLLNFSGGITFNGYFQRVHLERIVPFDQRDQHKGNILSLDVNFNTINSLRNSNYKLEDGDVVNILSIDRRPENRIAVSGDVQKPGTYELSGPEMTVRDLIQKADGIFPDAFMDEAILFRILPSRKKEVLSFNLKKALDGDPENNYVLQNLDEVKIFNNESFHTTRFVEILGEVKKPGKYIRYENMNLTDLIVLAGGVTERAFTNNIEISRLDTNSSDVYYKTFSINLPKNYWNASSKENFTLNDYDRVFIKSDTVLNFENKVVNVQGEVRFPGSYSLLKNGERLSDLIDRAEGFKNSAYKEGIYVNRYNSLFEKTEQSVGLDSSKENFYNKPVFNKKTFADFSNRIPVNWAEVEKNSNAISNIILQPGDEIVVPKDPQIIYVLGEVGVPSNVPYKKGGSLSYYIENAGGYATNAAKGKEIVILPNGKKWSTSGWFFIPDPPITSGSTIFIPTFFEEKTDSWPVIRDVFTVISTTTIVILTVINLTKK